MRKLKFTTVIGCLAAATLVYFNVRHALNDYGVRDNEKLHPEVMAQTGTTNGNGSGSGSSGCSSESNSTSNWQNKKLKKTACQCKRGDNKGKSGFTLQCKTDGDLEKCTETQQGSDACYTIKVMSATLVLLCDGKDVD